MLIIAALCVLMYVGAYFDNKYGQRGLADKLASDENAWYLWAITKYGYWGGTAYIASSDTIVTVLSLCLWHFNPYNLAGLGIGFPIGRLAQHVVGARAWRKLLKENGKL